MGGFQVQSVSGVILPSTLSLSHDTERTRVAPVRFTSSTWLIPRKLIGKKTRGKTPDLNCSLSFSGDLPLKNSTDFGRHEYYTIRTVICTHDLIHQLNV